MAHADDQHRTSADFPGLFAPPPVTADQSSAGSISPQAETERIPALDVLRGVAVLGILLMNITAMGLPAPAYEDPTVVGGATGWDLRAWQITTLFFEGSMRALFSLLFGAGAVLFLSRAAPPAQATIADLWYRRTIWLFVFGLIHAYLLLWPGDILYGYGLMGMFLFPLRGVAPARLVAGAMGLLVAGGLAYGWSNSRALEAHRDALAAADLEERTGVVPPELLHAREEWFELVSAKKATPEAVQREIDEVRRGYLSAWIRRANDSTYTRSYHHFRYDYFDVLSLMLLGMAFAKCRIFDTRGSARRFTAMMLLGYGIGGAVNWREMSLLLDQEFAAAAFYQSNVTYDVGRLAMMLGHLGFILLVVKSGVAEGFTRVLAAVGRMALTNYLLQTVITTIVFVAFGQFGQWQRHQLYYLVATIWVLQLTISPVWLRYFYFGPLEWGWRRLTYWAPQPFRRNSPPKPLLA